MLWICGLDAPWRPTAAIAAAYASSTRAIRLPGRRTDQYSAIPVVPTTMMAIWTPNSTGCKSWPLVATSSPAASPTTRPATPTALLTRGLASLAAALTGSSRCSRSAAIADISGLRPGDPARDSNLPRRHRQARHALVVVDARRDRSADGREEAVLTDGLADIAGDELLVDLRLHPRHDELHAFLRQPDRELVQRGQARRVDV